VSRLLERANWITLALCVGVIQFSAYYFLSATVRADGLLAVAQPDAALYLQAARRIAEGGAFTYSAGGPIQTGTTSVLYPFILSLPSWLGLSCGALVTVGFLLNAACYLVFLFSWLKICELRFFQNPRTRWSPSRQDRRKSSFLTRLGQSRLRGTVPMLALVLFGQFAFVAFAQSDMGLWMALSSIFALGLAKDKVSIWGAALVVAPWVRPEGMVCVMAVALVAAVVRPYRKVALLGLLSVAAVFLLNDLLTGTWQFSSVQGKGHFAIEPFFCAVRSSFHDAMTMLRQLFLGFSSGSFREMMFFPVLGAVCLWYHVFHRDYRDFTAREAIFLLAAAGGFATVATSGWQGTNFDRYLAWMMPVAVIWTARGAVELGARLNGFARFLPSALILLFGCVGAVMSAIHFRLACEQTEIARAFYERCESVLPKGASVGGYGNAAAVYWLSPRRYVHLYGIYTPALKTKNLLSAFEILKYEPASRFDYWLYEEGVEGDLVPESARAIFGETVLAGPQGRALRKADWTFFDAARETPAVPAKGLSCKARVDVGYESDERAADYQVHGAFAQRAPEPVIRLDELGGRKLVEVGRVVTGSDEMTAVGLQPGRDVVVVMRTALRQKAPTIGPAGTKADEYAFAPAQALQVFVDGADVGLVHYEVPEKGFADVSFRIPAEVVTSPAPRLTFVGEHVTFGYWFYQ